MILSVYNILKKTNLVKSVSSKQQFTFTWGHTHTKKFWDSFSVNWRPYQEKEHIIFPHLFRLKWTENIFNIVFGVMINANTVEPPISDYGRWSLMRAQTIMGQNLASLAYGFVQVKSWFSEKIQYFPLRDLHLLHYPWIR